jgi:hypothetical protein
MNLNVTQSTFGAQTYTVNLVGGTTGSFTISGGPAGSGTYTYTPSGNNASLRLDYGEPNVGDFDQMNLAFTSANAASFTGNQKAGTDQGPLVGTASF